MTALSYSSSSVTQRLIAELSALIGRLTLSPASDGEPALTSTQRLALLELKASKPLRLHELADRIGTSAPTASRAVDGLVAAGLVERAADTADRRAVLVGLTAHGRERIDARIALVAERLDPALGTLARPERDQLLELLTRVNGALP